MENVRKRMEMKLVSCDRRLQKLINKSTFKYCTTYSENLNAVTLENKIINFCKPIYIGNFPINNIYIYMKVLRFLMYIGLAVLDISKSLIYDYHYNVMQKHYGDKIELMYTDTGIIFIYYLLLVRYIHNNNFHNL